LALGYRQMCIKLTT